MSYMSWCHVIFTKCSQVKVHDPDVLTGSASRLPRKTENTQSKKCPLPTSSNIFQHLPTAFGRLVLGAWGRSFGSLQVMCWYWKRISTWVAGRLPFLMAHSKAYSKVRDPKNPKTLWEDMGRLVGSCMLGEEAAW